MLYDSEHTEKSTLQALVTGDERAFQEIFHQYYDPLVQFAMGFTKSMTHAEEVVQEVFIKVWKNREMVDYDLPFRPYIYKITKNHLLNFMRKAAYEDNLKKELIHRLERARNTTEEQLYGKEYQQQIHQALARLTPLKQEIYHLSRETGKSHEEIAAQLGLAKSTVKNHLVQVLAYLRDFLKKI